MSLASLIRAGRTVDAGATYPSDADSLGPVVTSGNANVKGAWTTLLDPTPDGGGFGIWLTLFNLSTSRDYYFDIGIAPTGTTNYVTIWPDLALGMGTGVGQVFSAFIPIFWPGGKRIGIRSQASTGTAGANAQAQLMQGDFIAGDALRRATAYGLVTATTRGTTLDSGATAHTKPSSWTQLIASSTNPMKLFMVGITKFFARTTNVSFLLDIAIGAAASEQTILRNLPFWFHGSSDQPDMGSMLAGPFLCDVPAGKRLSARVQSSSAVAADRVADVVLYGVD